MERTTMVCGSEICAGAARYVEPAGPHAGLYRVADDPEAAGALVAADAPICPRCGGALVAAARAAAPAPKRRAA